MPRKNERDRRKAKGLCGSCGGCRPDPPFLTCGNCRAAVSKYMKEVWVERRRTLRQERRAKRLCLECGKNLGRSRTQLCAKCNSALLSTRARRNSDPNYKASVKANQKRYRKKHAKRLAEYARQALRVLKIEVFGHYGARCACCGEEQVEFLTIDHKKGNGAHMRRTGRHPKGGAELYRWLKKKHYPKSFQVLCFNCNCAKRDGDICPHQRHS